MILPWLYKGVLNDFFGDTIDNAVNATGSGKPAFFSIDEDHHFVMIALVPSQGDPSKLSVLYLNSINESSLNLESLKEDLINTLGSKEFGLKEEQIQSLKSEFIDKIGNISVQEFHNLQKNFVAEVQKLNPKFKETNLLQAQLNDVKENIVYNKKYSKVGKDFATALVENLKSRGIEIEPDKVINKSKDQQLDNCCSLSVASNIASVSTHLVSNQSLDTVDESLFSPINRKQKETYYKNFGKKLFTELDTVNLNAQPTQNLESHNDLELQKKLAIEQLDSFFKQQKSTNLNDEMLNKMQEAIVSILTPICIDQQEQDSLKKNAAKLVRQCAADVGKKMSWSQVWERFKDKVSDVVGSLIRQENPVKTIMDQHPKLKETLENNLKSGTISKAVPPINMKKTPPFKEF